MRLRVNWRWISGRSECHLLQQNMRRRVGFERSLTFSESLLFSTWVSQPDWRRHFTLNQNIERSLVQVCKWEDYEESGYKYVQYSTRMWGKQLWNRLNKEKSSYDHWILTYDTNTTICSKVQRTRMYEYYTVRYESEIFNRSIRGEWCTD